MNKIKIDQGSALIITNVETWTNELGKSIHMPRIQRDFVWKPKK